MVRSCAVLPVVALGCGPIAADAGDAPTDEPREESPLPPGFPRPPVPENNPSTDAKIELGRFLFYDVRLSAGEYTSCATCHRQELAFTDGAKQSAARQGALPPRNTPSLANVAYAATLTWADAASTTLEQKLENDGTEVFVDWGDIEEREQVLSRLVTDDRYGSMFREAFDELGGAITTQTVSLALSAFLRTLISSDSPFDRYTYRGKDDALSASALRGLGLLFTERLECHHCHGGFNFTDASRHDGSGSTGDRFHNIGLYNLDGDGAYPASDTGLFAVTDDPADMGRFRAPTLRNVAVTAPYMHDGSLDTLEDVLRFYEGGGRHILEGDNAGDGRASPLKSEYVSGFTLTDEERRDVLAFFESLTDDELLTNPRFSDPFDEQR